MVVTSLPVFATTTDSITFADGAFGSLGTGALTPAATTAWNASAAQTITDLAAQGDSSIYQVDFESGFTYTTGASGDLTELEAAITGGEHTGAAFFLISNSDGDTRLYYDADTNAGTDGTGLVHMATLSGIDDATLATLDADITIV